MKQAIILAGGMGTRLRSVVADVPKPMATVAGKPFLAYLLHFAYTHGINKLVLSVGYKHELIQAYCGSAYKDMEIVYSVEDEPLGTGGAILKALSLCDAQEVYILNGDTFFDISMHDLAEQHATKRADLTIALKYLTDFDRYGTVDFDLQEKITAFREKQAMKQGYINGGIYLLHRDFLLDMELPSKFSFEQTVLERLHSNAHFYAYTGSADRYFIDIGIPEDYARVQLDFDDPRRHYRQ